MRIDIYIIAIVGAYCEVVAVALVEDKADSTPRDTIIGVIGKLYCREVEGYIYLRTILDTLDLCTLEALAKNFDMSTVRQTKHLLSLRTEA